MAEIRVHDHSRFVCKQSKHGHLPSLPCRGILIGPSGSGKSTVMSSMILDHYRGCFARIYIMSPSIFLDSVWDPVKEYIRNVMKVGDSEKCYFDEWDPEALQRVLTEHTAVVKTCKERGKHCHGALFLIDDFADDERLHTAGRSNILNQLFVRGRHSFASCWVSSQRLHSISTPVKVNTQFYIILPLRSAKEKESLFESLSAVHSMKTLEKLYQLATSKDHSFLYVNLKNPVEFYVNFTHRLSVKPSGHSSPPSQARKGAQTVE
jgi:adenylate kinase family enzyme